MRTAETCPDTFIACHFRPPSEESLVVENKFLRLDQANHCATTLRGKRVPMSSSHKQDHNVLLCSCRSRKWLGCRNATMCFRRPRHLPLRALLATCSQPWNKRTETHWLVLHQSSFPALRIAELHVLIPPSVALPLVQESIVRYT